MNHIVFLIEIKDINWNIALVQSELEKTGLFVPFENDYLHVTLKWAWLYMSKEEMMDDAKSYLENKIAFTEAIRPFKLIVKWINFFSNVVFIQCFDEWMLALIHEQLILYYKLDVKQRRDLDNYIPHIAIWTYKEEEGNDKLFELWEQYQEYEFWDFEINTIALCNVIRNNTTKFPKIEVIEEINL